MQQDVITDEDWDAVEKARKADKVEWKQIQSLIDFCAEEGIKPETLIETYKASKKFSSNLFD